MKNKKTEIAEQPIDLQAAIRADDEKNSALDQAACEADQPTNSKGQACVECTGGIGHSVCHYGVRS